MKVLALRIFDISKAHLLRELQESLTRVEQIIETGPKPVGEDKETGGFEEIYQQDYDRAMQRLPRLQILRDEFQSLTFDKLEGVITGPQTTVY